MACELTKGRQLDCRDTVGGVKAVYFVQHADASINEAGGGAGEEPASGTISDIDITNSGSGDKLFKYEVTRGTASFTETITGSTENGTVFFDQSVNIKLHKLSIADRNEIKLLSQNRLIVFVELNQINSSGKRVIVALGVENGLQLNTGTNVSGAALGDMAGSDLTFSGQESFPASIVADYSNSPFDNTAFTVTVHNS
ncbi:MAG: hypothetical protein CML17_13920 [Pusillimonas sp.]|jgi:hypothetical protein|nr:hypothetical protein [Pusillimonas sp.]